MEQEKHKKEKYKRGNKSEPERHKTVDGGEQLTSARRGMNVVALEAATHTVILDKAYESH